jgi:osmotically-inducible protein OsmY
MFPTTRPTTTAAATTHRHAARQMARAAIGAVAAATLAGALAGCAPLLLGGAVMGTGLVVTDRRTTGTQLEDESIELKAAARVRELATLGNVNVTSYNRTVLITGEVPGEAEKAAVEAAVARVENVKAVVNELGIGQNSTLGSRSTDAIIAGRVKASMVDAKDIQANAYKVVSERGIVYLMGRVTEREANRGAEIASAVNGVQKVVKVFEILTEQELANLGRGQPPAQTAPVRTP